SVMRKARPEWSGCSPIRAIEVSTPKPKGLCWRRPMLRGSPFIAIAFASLLLGADHGHATDARSQTTDPSKLPEWTGQWVRAHIRSQWDPSKPRGLQQEAPFTEEYLEIFKANLAQLRASGQGVDPQLRCFPSGTPRVMM